MTPWIDPGLEALAEEQRALTELARVAGRKVPRPGAIDAASLRRARLYTADGAFRPPLSPAARDERLATEDGEVLVRVFPVEAPAGVVVHFHGGGWVLGSVHEQDSLLAALSEAARVTIFSIDYPLAPEVGMARALEVATAALAQLLRDTAPRPVCVIGESAGAQVALQAVLRLRSSPPLFDRVRGLSLGYGIYDLSMTPSQRAWGPAFIGLSTDWLEWFYAQTLPGWSRDERSDPAVSPLYAALAGLPPVLLSVGQRDPLLDDSLFLFERLRAAGNAAALAVYPEAPHGFNHAVSAMAASCNARIARFLAAMAGPGA